MNGALLALPGWGLTLMPWFNVDDSFYDHPKVWDAPDCAVALWCRAGSWSARSKRRGFVPAGMPARLCGDPEAAVRELLERGLWQRTKGGYLFHDWADWNLSSEQVEQKKAQNAERQRRFREGRKESGQEEKVTLPVTRDVTRDKRVSNGSQSNPDLSLVSVVDHLSRRIAHAYEDDDLVQTIVDSIHNRTGQVIPAAHASVVAAEILGGRNPDNPKAYVQKAILTEKDPKGRFLPRPETDRPSPPPWCGECSDELRRQVETPDGVARCPNCHPLRRAS